MSKCRGEQAIDKGRVAQIMYPGTESGKRLMYGNAQNNEEAHSKCNRLYANAMQKGKDN